MPAYTEEEKAVALGRVRRKIGVLSVTNDRWAVSCASRYANGIIEGAAIAGLISLEENVALLEELKELERAAEKRLRNPLITHNVAETLAT